MYIFPIYSPTIPIDINIKPPIAHKETIMLVHPETTSPVINLYSEYISIIIKTVQRLDLNYCHHQKETAITWLDGVLSNAAIGNHIII